MYYLMGIDGRNTPDPQYWHDRWSVIQAKDENEAMHNYEKEHEGWLQPSERQYVKIWKVSPEPFSPMAAMRELGFGRQ